MAATIQKIFKKKFVIEERAPYGVVTSYRGRGNYLQRLEQFEKAIQAYDEALRWNNADVRSQLGRSIARAKATHYDGALADVLHAIETEPENVSAQQIRAQTEYERCAFERALVLAHRGQRTRRFPPDFAECARHAEETIGECVAESAGKVLSAAVPLLRRHELRMSMEAAASTRVSRIKPQPTQQTQEISRAEKQKYDQIARLMASKYLERMAHDKYFLARLCKDERLVSANRRGSGQLRELAHRALADLEKRQAVLRERRPLYAARAAEAAARERLGRARKEILSRTQHQHVTDANRLLQSARTILEERDTAKCLESTEFALHQISKITAHLLPGKETFLQQLYDIMANAFLDQKRVGENMSESDREKRAFVLLGLALSREPSYDSVLRFRPQAPPRDVKDRLRQLERALNLSARPAERCYILHELSRFHAETKQSNRTRFYAIKCQSEARAANQRLWLLNATFLLARGHILQNNRPEARTALLEGANLARSFGYWDVSSFFDTCANVSTEGEVRSATASLEKRERAMVSLMQDADLRSAAEHLFRRMSAVPASRRFSVMPGARAEDSAPPSAGRRASIMPRTQQPARAARRAQHPLGYQDFDY